MGKTPGKWIKTLLLGKKTSNPTSWKGRDILKSANKGEALVCSKVLVSDITMDSPSILPVLPEIGSKNGVDSKKGVAAELINVDVILSSAKEDSNGQNFINLTSIGDSERIMLENAATKAQAAFRGHVARRAFRTLKGIIRLQALIRGRLVRRQAVATLCCVWGIVKLQALARGQKDSSSFGINTWTKAENLRKHTLGRKLFGSSPTAMPLRLHFGSGEPNSAWEWLERWTLSRFWEPLSHPKKNLDSRPRTKRNNFQTVDTEQVRPKRSVRKLSSANIDDGSIHSTKESEKPKRNLKKVSSDPVGPVQEHPQIEIEKVKRNLRRISNPRKEVSDQLEVDNEKLRHSLRKGPSSSARNISEHGTSDSAEKVKDTAVALMKQSDIETNEKLLAADDNERPGRSLRKAPSSACRNVSEQSTSDSAEKMKDTAVAVMKQSDLETNEKPQAADDNERSRQSLRKAPSSAARNFSEQGTSDSAKKMKDTAVAVTKQSDLETNEKLLAADDPVDKLHNHPDVDSQSMECNAKVENNQGKNELNSEADHISNENQKTSQRRASMPAKADHQENELHSTPRVPSYMAPTVSAKAKLRGQSSPRFALDGVENNGVTRRHSLPSGKLSSLSPRVQRLVQATGKGVTRNDRSLTSSKDGGDKLIQAGWRR